MRSKIINGNTKIIQEAIKECLDKPDDEIFCEAVDQTFTVRDAKNANKFHELFRIINRKIQGQDLTSINKL